MWAGLSVKMLFSSNYQIMNSGNLIFNICMSKVHCALPRDSKLKVNAGPEPVPDRAPGVGAAQPLLCALPACLSMGSPSNPMGTQQEEAQAQAPAPGGTMVRVDAASGEMGEGLGPRMQPPPSVPAQTDSHHWGPGPRHMFRSTVWGGTSIPSCPQGPRAQQTGRAEGSSDPRPWS